MERYIRKFEEGYNYSPGALFFYDIKEYNKAVKIIKDNDIKVSPSRMASKWGDYIVEHIPVNYKNKMKLVLPLLDQHNIKYDITYY